MTRQKRLLLIGCGEYARTAHLPVLMECQSDVQVAAVVVGKGDVNNTRGALDSFQRDIPVYAAPRNIDATINLLSNIISHNQLALEPFDGAIVSTISAFNFRIVHLCGN